MAEIEISVTGYCTMGHLELFLPQRTFNSSSSPTRANVLSFITDHYHQMNGVLEVLGYELPIPSGNATAIGILRHINVLGAASQAEQSANQIGNIRPSQVGNALRDEFQREWKLFMDGDKNLPGATRTSRHREDKQEKEAKHQFDVDTSGDQKDAVFTKDVKF